MIDHVSIAVSDLAASGEFYDAVLAPLGYRRLADHPARIGFGKRYPEIWLNHRPDLAAVPADTGAHVCLRATSIEAVQEFHAVALARHSRDDGAPGLRAATNLTYYAAFVRDPDGNKLEAMTVPRP
jgi:catechol 2,3-dioxygenase-like lactoylglutathione lyase family enzyme